MAICCNPGYVGLWLTKTFPPDLIGKIEHSGAGRMRVWAEVISANSNFDDIVGFSVEGNRKQALAAYEKAFTSYKSARERLENMLANMPDTAAEFISLAERNLKEEIGNLGLDKAGLDYTAFFSSQLLELQRLENRIDTLLAIEPQGRKLLEQDDITALWRLMVESIRALTEMTGTNMVANAGASRLAGEFGQLITREIEKSRH